MAALSPPSAPRRPRPGSLERPVNGRLYRGTWLLVGIPLLIAALTVAKPAPLPGAQPPLPAAFDGTAAMEHARELATFYPNRVPGSPGYRDAGHWLASQLAVYGLRTREVTFAATIPGRGRVRLRNFVATVPGRSPQAIVVMAHLDDTGRSPGANANASGIGALLELARLNAVPAAASTGRAQGLAPAHTLVFLATDGGSFGSLGADRFAKTYRGHVVAVLNLDAIGGSGRPRVVLAGSEARSPAAALVETAAARVRDQTGRLPARAGTLAQLLDLAFPFSLFEQAPFVGRGIPAITLTTAGERPPTGFTDSIDRLHSPRFSAIGRSAQDLLRSLDQGAELTQGTSSYLYLGARIVRGWALEFVLVAALLPFLIAAVDLFARCRRRHIPLVPALRSYRNRLVFWLWVVAVFELFALIGVWPGGAALPVAPQTPAAGDWPRLGLLGLVLLAALGWLVARDRLLPRRAVTLTEELAGTTVALLVLALVGLLVAATNPFALIFVLPSMHAWLWLPHVRDRPLWARGLVLAAGLSGPLLLLGSLAIRFGLGLDAPWYLAELVAIQYVKLPTVVIATGWLAAAAQLAAITAGRYAPYPGVDERPRYGPLRRTLRRIVLGRRARRRASQTEEQALES
jgi:hypothetical protein